MNINSQNLPLSNNLNISTLSQLFDVTTNSYKYLFFNALLDILARNLFDYSTKVYFRELVIEMLANAWYPHIFFKLSFGKQDQITNKLAQLNIESYTEKVTKKERLINLISQQNLDDISNSLMGYVPFRLIRPFFAQQLKGEKDYFINPKITELSITLFDRTKPIYCFNHLNYKLVDSIILHPEWVKYFKHNFTIIKGWVAWEWLNYMQKNNQNTPNLASKLFPLDKRESLHQQAKYWKIILEKQPIKCIYSGQFLDKNTISIDHYLPWSFVVHDRLWNLIPTMNNVNSSKSNNIPSSQYLVKFIQLQHQGLTISHQYLTQKEWLKYTENYLLDLKIKQSEDLLNLELLTNIYNRHFQPLISLAKIQGFNDNWIY